MNHSLSVGFEMDLSEIAIRRRTQKMSATAEGLDLESLQIDPAGDLDALEKTPEYSNCEIPDDFEE